MRRWLFSLLFVSAVLFAKPAIFAAEPWMNSYQAGMSAIQKSDWKGAIEHLEKAVAAKPKEVAFTNLRTGSGPYLPHFWLGTAKLQLGDKEGAARELRLSESQEAIQKTTHYAELRNALARIDRDSTSSGDQALAAARTATDKNLALAIAARGKATAAGGARTDVYRRAAQKLQEAFDLKKAGDASSLTRAAAAAKDAAELFASVSAAAKKPSPAITKDPKSGTTVVTTTTSAPPPVNTVISKTAAEQKLRELRDEIGAARSGRSSAELTTFTKNALELAADWESSLSSASSQNDVEAIERGIAQQRSELRRIVASIPTTTTTSTPAVELPAQTTTAVTPGETKPLPTVSGAALRKALLSAYIPFARGELDLAEERSSAIIAGNKSFEAYMLRGCTRYTRALLLNKKELESAAASDFVAALKLKPSAALDRRAFSPRLVSFFESQRKQ